MQLYTGTSEPKTYAGTPQNMAPTVFQNKFKTQYYNEKIDIWSLGTLCYEMLFGKPLFLHMNEDEIIKNILLCNFKIPKTISVQARNFLLSMLRQFVSLEENLLIFFRLYLFL